MTHATTMVAVITATVMSMQSEHRGPQPAPTPSAQPSSPPAQSGGSVQDRIARTWPGDDRAALSVAKCESSFDPKARNGSHIGLYQLSGRYHRDRAARLGYSWDRMTEVEPNVRVAWDLYSEQNWKPWSCKPR